MLLSVALISPLSPAVDRCSSPSYICCWLRLCLLSFTFYPPPPLFWLGLLSGASWGKAWSLSVCATVHVLVFLFVSRALLPLHQPPCVCSSRPLWAKCFDQMSCFVICCSYHQHHSHNQRCWHLLCLPYVTVFVLLLCRDCIITITCSPHMGYVLCVLVGAIY